MSTYPTYQQFAEQIDTAFALVAVEAEGDLELKLASAEERNNSAGFCSFSLIFSQETDRVLDQSIYRLSHEVLGSHDIFLVPIGYQQGKAMYQAVFNISESEQP